MKLTEYQEKAMETAIFPKEHSLVYPALGLVGEAGEVAEKVKKVIRDNKGEMDCKKREEIAKELGDVLWYLAALSTEIGYELEDIAKINLDKLASRHSRGVLKGSGDNR